LLNEQQLSLPLPLRALGSLAAAWDVGHGSEPQGAGVPQPPIGREAEGSSPLLFIPMEEFGWECGYFALLTMGCSWGRPRCCTG